MILQQHTFINSTQQHSNNQQIIVIAFPFMILSPSESWEWRCFFKKWNNPGLFLFIFVLFTLQFKWQIYNLNNIKWKKRRWCAWDSNPERQDVRHRQIHWAMAAPQRVKTLCSVFALTEVQTHNPCVQSQVWYHSAILPPLIIYVPRTFWDWPQMPVALFMILKEIFCLVPTPSRKKHTHWEFLKNSALGNIFGKNNFAMNLHLSFMFK